MVYQSRRHALYRAALDDLVARGLAYPCTCSRKDWHAAARLGADGFVYDGTCARKKQTALSPFADRAAWRMRVPDETVAFHDRIVGAYGQNLAQDIGDFVLLRADGFWAYQLAVVVDDGEQGITHIVRGQDLLVSTPRQIYLQSSLHLPTPHYAHLPLLTNRHGQKWSKQTRAEPLDMHCREALLRQVLHYLGLPDAPAVDKPRDLLAWAAQHWQISRVPPEAVCTETE